MADSKVAFTPVHSLRAGAAKVIEANLDELKACLGCIWMPLEQPVLTWVDKSWQRLQQVQTA